MPFTIVRNDITKMNTDAIVNTANPNVVVGSGVERAIYRKAGYFKMLAERRKIGKMEPGQAAISPAGKLAAKYVIHTVGPLWQGGENGERKIIRECYRNSLALAKERGCESVAFPLLATGNNGFPKGEALQIAAAEIREFLRQEELDVYLVVFDNHSFTLSGEIFSDVEAYIDENYVETQLPAEYSYREEEAAVNRSRGLAPDEDFAGVRESAPLKADFLMQSVPIKGAGPKKSARVEQSATPMPDAAPIKGAAPKKSAPFMQSAASVQGATPMKTAPTMKKAAPMKASMPVQETAPLEDITCLIARRTLEDAVREIGESFQVRLLRLIDERNLSDVEIYKKANLDRKLFSKIRCNEDYRPQKRTALALAVALRLNLDETKDLLARAGHALSPSSRFDLIVSYFIEHEVYDIDTINLALFQYEEPILGN